MLIKPLCLRFTYSGGAPYFNGALTLQGAREEPHRVLAGEVLSGLPSTVVADAGCDPWQGDYEVALVPAGDAAEQVLFAIGA
mgnify:CR=1 FL=1